MILDIAAAILIISKGFDNCSKNNCVWGSDLLKNNKMDLMCRVFENIGISFCCGNAYKIESFYNGSGDASYTCTLISCFFADGVAVFWMILGFFFFKDIVTLCA